MRRMRADLESVAADVAPLRLGPVRATSTRSLADDLRELVAALDRRVPHLEREGELAIARDASALRAAALKRIAEIERLPATLNAPASPVSRT
jgi:hypothetical protein